MALLTVLFGAIVGFSLGLTGGGGAIFAVPLLVYGLATAPSEAVGISLASVGAMSAVGLLKRWRTGQVEPKPGFIFAVAGMLGTPVGSWLAGQVSEQMLLLLFSALMLLVAVRMWTGARRAEALVSCAPADDDQGPTCRRDAAGVLRLTSRCAILLAVIGIATGVLAGLFGVGGGFVIVPALVVFSGMPIHRAMGTSLLVITLISLAGVSSHLLMGRSIPLATTLPFVAGGVLGMWLGILTAGRLSGPALQRAFSVAIIAVAIFVISKNLYDL
ncbi:MAG: sulfite exporter TauE/SafE family protein [Planctomycetaceae bacterium]